MIIQLTDVRSCHGCRVIETKVLRPPAHTCACAGSPQEAVSQFLGTETTCRDLCKPCICVCVRWQVTDANGTAQAKLSDLQNTLMRAGNSISAQNTIISLQLLSLVLGARPRRPDLLQHTCVCTQTGQAALTVSVRRPKPYPACTQEHMTIN